MRQITIAIFLIFAGTAEMSSAQVCRRDSIPESTPTQRFTLQDDGSALDKFTGLTWQRCPVGQKLTVDGNGLPECAGRPYLDGWSSALLKAKLEDERLQGAGKWRIPTIKELVSIVDVQCYDPPFNRAIFPASWSTSPDSIETVGYWTSTPGPAYKNKDQSPPSPMAWGLLLNDGASGRFPLTQPMMILLVKNP